MTTTNEKQLEAKVDWLKYVNTFILTMILGFAMMIFSTLNKVKELQSAQATELMRIKTVQDANTSSIANLNTRVTAIELNRLEEVKSWVETNFQRKK